MSGAAKDLFGQPNQSACSKCHTIYKTPEKALECQDDHEREERRARARAFARGGPSQKVVKP